MSGVGARTKRAMYEMCRSGKFVVDAFDDESLVFEIKERCV